MLSVVINAPFLSVEELKLAQDSCSDCDLAPSSISSLKLVLRLLDDLPILGDISHDQFRPYLPTMLRSRVMNSFHDLAHIGIRPTIKAIRKHYVWHGMRKDISAFVKECLECQQSKVGIHSKHPVRQFEPEPTGKFTHVHCDIVGPLPESCGFKYIFTVVDRVTRWPIAVPMTDMTAASCAQAFLSGWVSMFGVPVSIVSDRGRQFISHLWSSVLDVLGSEIKNYYLFLLIRGH